MSYLNQEFQMHTDDMGNQTGNLRVNLKATPSAYTGVVNKFVQVSLEGTMVMAASSGAMQSDEKDLRQWYTEQVEVWITTDSAKIAIEDDAPTTTAGGKSTTSSTNFNLGANAGVFGKDPTAGINVGLSVGHSFTVDLTDFKTQNLSTNSEVYHKYLMASSSGAAYSEWQDLVNMTAVGQLEGNPLYEIPDLAICNLPLASQAILMTTPNEDVTDVVTVTARIRTTLRSVEKTFQVVKVHEEGKSHAFDFSVPLQVDLSTVSSR